MTTLLLCNPSPNQRALANRLHRRVGLDAIAIVTPALPKRRPDMPSRLLTAFFGLAVRRAWHRMQSHYEKEFPQWPPVVRTEHNGVNSPSVLEVIERLSPDLVLVSGTDLLKQPVIDAIGDTGKTINLHTGISPHVRGGPNCTNWCLATGQPELIGNTVMWIDAGIDSGNIIATERTELNGPGTLTDLHVAVMDHAHDLYARVAGSIIEGKAVPNVPQRKLGTGKLYLTRDWTALQGLKAWFNFTRLSPLRTGRSSHPLVPLTRSGNFAR